MNRDELREMATKRVAWKSGTVTSADGGVISYRQIGQGPGLILVHGGMETWQSHKDLARALADSFTLYLADRRGRGATCDPGPDYGIQTEVNDVEALARKTGARYIYGLSSGAIIALQSALKLGGMFDKIIVFEPPPMAVDPERHNRLYAQFQEELKRDDIASALMTGMRMTLMGPLVFQFIPYWMARPFLNWYLEREEAGNEEHVKAGQLPLKSMVPTMNCDFKLVQDMVQSLETFVALEPRLLILSGTASRPFLIQSCEELEATVPDATHVRLQGLTHGASGNKDAEGQPDIVAKAMRDFLLDGSS